MLFIIIIIIIIIITVIIAGTHLHEAGDSPTAFGADPNSPDLLPACFGLCQEVLDVLCHVATSLNHGTEEVDTESHRLTHELLSLDPKQGWV